MSDNDERDSKRNVTENLWEIERRRVLQLAGVGIGSLGMVGAGTGVASAAPSDCADGPFERSFEGATITLSELPSAGTGEEDDDESGDDEGEDMDMSAARLMSDDERRAARATVRGRQPPSGQAQRADEEDEGEGDGDMLRVGTEYDGVNAGETRGGVPSDSQIATNEDKNVHALNTNVAIFEKESGERELKVQLEDIWKPVISEPEGGFVFGRPFVFDPRARYDRNAGRFVLCAVQFEPGITESGNIIDREKVEEGVEPGEGEEGKGGEKAPEVVRPPRGWFLVAVSASDDPTEEWHVYRIPPVDENGIENKGLVDYPTLGLDRDAVYLTQNFFGIDHFEVTMVTLDKAAMYAGEEVTTYHFDNMQDPSADGLTFTVQPAFQPFSGGSSETYHLVNSNFTTTTSDTLTLWELTDPLDEPTLTCFTLDVNPYSIPPPAQQPNTKKVVDTLGNRLMNADSNDGSLWTAHTLAQDWNGDGTPVAAIRWYEIDTDSREVVQSGTYGEAETSYFIPTVGSDDETTVICHSVSSPDIFPRMDVAGRTAAFTPGQIEDSVVVEEGKSKYVALDRRLQRWGDYNGVSVDPETGHFWAVSQYSPDINIPPKADRRDPYHTRIAEVSFPQEEEDEDDGDDGGDGDD